MQAVAVKIFSLMPTSMVDESAMSVVTWLNSPRRNRQGVATVSNHIRKRGISFCYFFLLFCPFPSLFRDAFGKLLQTFTNFGNLL
jgi:hypothetical protein